MALNPTAVFEIRGTTGSNNNGGGYDAGISGAGTDYSQSDTPILSLTDAACTAGSTTITSTTGGFTSAMIGNSLMPASGTNWTTGVPFFITGYTDPNTITVDRSPCPSLNGTGGNIKVGGAWANLTDAMIDTTPMVAGNTIWIKTGTTSFTIDVSSTRAGTAAANYSIIGYKTTRGDMPTLTDRPSIACGAYTFTLGASWTIKNVIVNSSKSAAPGFTVGSGSTIHNCSITNTSTNASSTGLNAGDNSILSATEIKCQYGTALASAKNRIIDRCYIHDSVTGVAQITTGNSDVYIFTIFDSISGTAINIGNTAVTNFRAINCLFYLCGTAINLSANSGNLISHCIFDSNTNAIVESGANPDLVKNNMFYNNGQDVSNITLDSTNITATNPYLNSPASGDFTISNSGSLALSSGYAMANSGLNGLYKMKIGIFQGDLSSSGAAGYAYWN